MEELMGLGEDLDGLAALDTLFGVQGLQADLIDVAVLGASAGVSVVAGEWLFANVDMLKSQTGYTRAVIAIALGAGGGILLGRYANKAVGAGVAAGLIGWGVSKAIQKATNMVPTSAGLGQMSDRDLLLGMGQAVDNDIYVSDYRPLPGQTDGLNAVDNEINVSDYRPLPGQTDGLGQAGDVYTSDLRPMPGQHGSSGYMAGLASSFA